MRALLLVAGLAGCAGDADPFAVRIDLPVRALDLAAVVGVERAGALEVYAVTIDEAGAVDPIPITFDLATELQVTALLYENTLAELELQPGRLTPDPTGTRALPPASSIQRMSVNDRATSEWAEQTQAPPSLRAFRLPTEDRCGQFEGRAVSLGAAASPELVLALDDRWVFVGTHGRRSFLVDAAGRIVVLDDLPSSFLAGYVEDGGKVWLGGDRGIVYEGAFTGGDAPVLSLTVNSTTAGRQPIWSLSGAPSGVPDERFALGWSPGVTGNWGGIEHFDGTDWWISENKRDPHNVTWVAPGFGLFATHFRDSAIIGLRDRVEVCGHVSSLVFGSIIEISQMPGIGLVAGTSGGEVHRHPAIPDTIPCADAPADGPWERLASTFTEDVTATHPYEDGLVYLSGAAMARIVVGADPCDASVIDRRDLQLGSSMTVVGQDVVVPLVVGDSEELNRPGLDDEIERFVGWFQRR